MKAITVDSVCKCYKLGIPNFLIQGLVRRTGRGHRLLRKKFWALEDISFQMERGDVLGVIGPNGAGKSTLLRLLSGVSYPTKGRIEVKGRVSPLIQVGAGFHPELTGRENIYLNGIILGMNRKEINRKLNDIITFSGIEEFIDTPVKKYSSGMYVRLGFSIAVHSEPKILLVDEILSVGDHAFSEKSYQRMLAIRHSGATIIFISHNMGAILTMCDRVIWLDHGVVKMDGEPEKVVSAYVAHEDTKLNQAEFTKSESFKDSSNYGNLTIKNIQLVDGHGQVRQNFETGDDLHVRIHYRAMKRIEQPNFVVHLTQVLSGLTVASADMLIDGQSPAFIEGDGLVECVFHSIPLLKGRYRIGLLVLGDFSMLKIVWPPLFVPFVVETPRDKFGWTEHVLYRSPGAIRIPYKWHIRRRL